MESQNLLHMKEEEKKPRDITVIEIDWENPEDLAELSTNDKFIKFELKESYLSILTALKNKENKAELFNIFNMSVIIEINKSQFKTVLNKVIQMLIEEEEYENCNKIKKLIEKYEI